MKIFKDKRSKQAMLSVLLFIVVIAFYIELNILISKINIPDIDVTDAKIYSLTEESKSKLSGIDKDIKIQLVNFDNYENYVIIDDVIRLIKQYEEISNKITVESITVDGADESISKYPYIIITSETKEDIILLDYLVSYKYNTDYGYEEEFYISEEVLTNSIINVTKNNTDKVYFYLEKSVYKNGTLFTSIINRLDSMGVEVKLLELSTNLSVPQDCKCIIIPPLGQQLLGEEETSADISNEEKDALVEYIKNGGNIMFLQESKSLMNLENPNLDYLMSLYGFSISDGLIIEKENKIQNNPGNIYANINFNNNVFKSLNRKSKLSMFEASKINLESEEKLKELGVTYQILATGSETAYLRRDMENSNADICDSDEPANGAILGLCAEKTIDGVTSKAIIYSNSVFAVNSPVYLKDSISNKNIGVEMILIDDNEEVVSNSIRYLINNNDIIMNKKVHYNLIPSSNLLMDGITLKIIFIIPMIIIFIGYFVWRHRKNKK